MEKDSQNNTIITNAKKSIGKARIAQSLLSSEGWKLIEEIILNVKQDFDKTLLEEKEINVDKFNFSRGKMAGLLDLKTELEYIVSAGGRDNSLINN